MIVHDDIDNLPQFKKPVVTISAFDGVHVGHQKLIQRLNELAEETGGESVIITFHPHPRLVIEPGYKELKLLTTLEEKIELLSHYRVDRLMVVPFDKAWSEL